MEDMLRNEDMERKIKKDSRNEERHGRCAQSSFEDGAEDSRRINGADIYTIYI